MWQAIAPFLLQVVRLCVWLALLTALFAPLERLFALHEQRLLRKAVLTDVGYYFLNSLVPGFLLGVPLALLALGVQHAIPVGWTAAVADWPMPFRVLAALVVGDVGFYWGHRWSHALPFLWRFHAVHHSAEQMDFLVNTRAHPVDMVFTRLCGLVPLYVLGLAAPLKGSATLVPLSVLLFGTMWGFFVHANLRWRLGPLEFFIATPAFHHWHHTNDGPTVINKNFAPLLPWVDRLFGTLHLPAGKQSETYGIDERLAPGLAGQLWEPLRFKASSTSPASERGNRSPESASGALRR